MKVYGGVDVYTHVSLTSAIVGVSRPGHFTSKERVPMKECPLLQTVDRERLVKTHQAGKGLAVTQ
jgi:hypothetical protein